MPLFVAFVLATSSVLIPNSFIANEETQKIVDATRASTTIELIDYYAGMYNVSAQEMTGTLMCESALKPKAYNPADPYGGAKGIGQFLQPTFDFYSPKAGIKKGDIWDIKDSLWTMAYMFSIGQAKQWTEWRWKYGDKPHTSCRWKVY